MSEEKKTHYMFHRTVAVVYKNNIVLVQIFQLIYIQQCLSAGNLYNELFPAPVSCTEPVKTGQLAIVKSLPTQRTFFCDSVMKN